MPWNSNEELPKQINNLPEHAKTIFRNAANSVFENGGDDSRAMATGYAAVKRTYKRTKEGWVEKELVGMNTVHVNQPEKDISINYLQKSYEFKITKSNEEKQYIFGYVMFSADPQGNIITDSEGDQIDIEDLEEMAYKYVRFYRDLGEQHITHGDGTLIESFVITPQKIEAMGIPQGILPYAWFCGFYVSDPTAWARIKNGDYQAFSIEGLAKRIPV